VVDTWYQNVEAIRRNGLKVRSPEGEFVTWPHAIHLDELHRLKDPVALAILAVKSYDTEWMTRAIAPYLTTETPVISAQNGLNEDVVAGVVGKERTIGAIVHIAAGMFEPGVVTRYSSTGWMSLTIGELDRPVGARATSIRDMLAPVGRMELSNNIRGVLWSKLMANSMINGLAGITGLTTPKLFSDPTAHSLMMRIGAETVAAATDSGVEVEAIELTGSPRALEPAMVMAAARSDPAAFEKVRDWMLKTAAARSGASENMPSLLQDVTKQRRTEIAYLNGHVVACAGGPGGRAPANEVVVELVDELGAGRLAQEPANLLLAAGRIGSQAG
jgi:2-dehydropantoate 2-reductase